MSNQSNNKPSEKKPFFQNLTNFVQKSSSLVKEKVRNYFYNNILKKLIKLNYTYFKNIL
jgi:hypothetical protein